MRVAMVEPISFVVLMGSEGVAISCWIYGLVEAIGAWRFWPWVFRSGVKVVEQNLVRSANLTPPAGRLEGSDVRAAMVDQGQILFRAPMGRFRLVTPFPIHGTVVLEAETLHVIGRISLGAAAFFAAWMMAWTTACIMKWLDDPLKALGLMLPGWLFIGAVIAFSLSLERRRFRRALDDLTGC